MQLKKIINIVPFLILGILSILSITGKIRFGFGLGDIVYHGLIYIGFLIYGIYSLITRKVTAQQINLIFPILSIVFCGYLLLTMTFWRGPEYRWDGNIFHSMQIDKK